MYRCPICGSICSFSFVHTYDGAVKVWLCPWCEWDSSNIETKNSTSTENIDLGRTTTSTEVTYG